MALKDEILTQTIVKEEIDAIQENINSDVVSRPDLSELVSVSKTANYKQWIFIVSYISWLFKQLWTEKKAEHQDLIDDNVAPNDRWTAQILKKFQYGDSLVFDENFKPSYALIDEEKQVIKYVSIRSTNGKFKALVAGDDGNGTPIALTNDQVTAADNYLGEYVLGKNGVVESNDADLANINYTLYYTANRPLADIKLDVEAAITTYLATLNFRGQYIQAKLEDAMQGVTNIEYFKKNSVQVKPSTGVYADADITYEPDAGYIQIDPAFPLSTNLSYQAV